MMPVPIRKMNGHPGLGGVLDLADAAPDPGAVDVDLHQPHRTRGVPPLRLRTGRQQPAQHLVGGPAHGGHGGNAQPFVHLGPSGVVDPGHHVVDAEGLPDHPGRQDVGVVAGGHRGERVGLFDAGLQQHFAVESDALHGLAGEVGSKPAEGLDTDVDHRDRVVPLLQAAGQARPDAAATHDHDVHGCESRLQARVTVSAVTATVGWRRVIGN